MNDEQLDLARRLAAHPKFKWQPGMLARERSPSGNWQPGDYEWRIVDGEPDLSAVTSEGDIQQAQNMPIGFAWAYPDLTDAATGGVLLDVLGPGWTVITRIGKVDAHPTGCAGPPGVSGATVAEACARALLAEWEATPATPETTAS